MTLTTANGIHVTASPDPTIRRRALINALAKMIASLPRDEQVSELGRLLLALRMAGVHGDAIEAMGCALGEVQ